MKRDTYRVAAVQMDCSGSKSQVEERARRMVREAARRGARIICLPEHWIPRGYVDPENGLQAFAKIATETGAYVIPGADYVKRGATLTVEGSVLGPDGEVGRQQKVHLFAGEKRKAKPGNVYSVFELEGIRVGIAICHDLVYPEVTRILTINGAEIIFAPAKIGAAGSQPWDLYVKARALENRVPIVSPNFLNPPRFPGGSSIVGFSVAAKEGVVYPKVLASAGSRPEVLVADLDLKTIKRYRDERLGARRPETYSDLLKPIDPLVAAIGTINTGKTRSTLKDLKDLEAHP